MIAFESPARLHPKRSDVCGVPQRRQANSSQSDAWCRFPDAKNVDRSNIDQLAVALEPHAGISDERGHRCTSLRERADQPWHTSTGRFTEPCSARPSGGISASFLMSGRTLLATLIGAFAFAHLRRTRANVFRMSVSTLLV